MTGTKTSTASPCTITTNRCPNHPTYKLNPNFAMSQPTIYRVPAYPSFVGTTSAAGTASVFQGRQTLFTVRWCGLWAGEQLLHLRHLQRGEHLRPVRWPCIFFDGTFLSLSRASSVLAETAGASGRISLTPGRLDSRRFSHLRSSWPKWRDDADMHSDRRHLRCRRVRGRLRRLLLRR